MADDYTDLIMPIDYTLDAFQFVNKKRYDKWKMIGMQFSHPYFKGINATNVNGSGVSIYSGPLQGFVSGCKPIEEINQNNHIVGRGGWYLRARRDGDNNSATYGIIGHCHQPDARSEIAGQYTDIFKGPIEGNFDLSNDNFPVRQSLTYSPIERNWGVIQSPAMCGAAVADQFGGGDLRWGMIAFYELEDGLSGEKRYFIQYMSPNSRTTDPINKAYESQGEGSFDAWIYLGGGNTRVYRTCEALLFNPPLAAPNQASGPITNWKYPTDMCINYKNPVFSSGASTIDPNAIVLPLQGWMQGAIIKLTSLPTCNHFEKYSTHRIPCTGPGSWRDNPVSREKRDICCNQDSIDYNPDDPVCFKTIRCERAVIRIMPVCQAYVAGKWQGKWWPTIEKHFDRWDAVIGDATNYKIFDELFEIPEAKMRIRVLAHSVTEIEKHTEELLKNSSHPYDRYDEQCMTVTYLTGGNLGDAPTGPKGCSCVNPVQNEDHYPIRPYNQFVYCANNFTCEKTC